MLEKLQSSVIRDSGRAYRMPFKPIFRLTLMLKISVVVCAKNDALYLEKCLPALRKQILRPEIIVVYGNSNDNTVEIAERCGADIVVQDNGKGLTDARNVGIGYSTGDVIAYCDADCFPRRDWTLRIAKAFADKSLLALSGPLILSGKSRLKLRLAFRVWAELFPAFFAAIGQHNIWGANMAFQKQTLEKFKFRGKFLEDFEMGHQIRHYLRAGNHGRIKFDRHLKMPCSDRRFERSFHRTALRYYVTNWFRIVLHKEAKRSYYESAKP